MFNKKYNILVLGHNGMLGYDVYNYFSNLAKSRNSNINVVSGIDIDDNIDISQESALTNYLYDKIHYDICINCIAYTDTKAAEDYSKGYDASYRLNALAPKYISQTCNKLKMKLIHISTDYVFSDKSDSTVSSADLTCFHRSATVFPVNNYGLHKLLGEQFIKEEFQDNRKNYCILRTSWLYGAHNNKSFIHKFINNVVSKLETDPNSEIKMTLDEFSVPTSTKFLTDVIYISIFNKLYGIHHAVPSCDSNGVSRFKFASEILKCFSDDDIVNGVKLKNVNLTPAANDSFYPKFSAMLGISCYDESIYAKQWIDVLHEFMDKHKAEILNNAKTINERK